MKKSKPGKYTKADLNAMATKIINDVQRDSPRAMKIVDIRAKINENVKKSYVLPVKPEKKIEVNWKLKRTQKAIDDFTDDDEIQRAILLSKMLKIDPTISINKELIYSEAVAMHQKRSGLRSKEKVGDILVPKNLSENIYEVIRRHSNRIKNERLGVQMSRDVSEVFNGVAHLKKQTSVISDMD
jgi:hypothetical protein